MDAPVELSDGATVSLRPVSVTDIDALHDGIAGDADIERWTRIPFPYSRELARDFIERSDGPRAAGTEFAFGIRTLADDRLVGGIGVHRVGAEPDPRSSLLPNEIGYWLRADARGRGVCSAAVRVLVRWAFDALAVDRLESQCATDNVRSRRVLERAGFRFVRTVPAAEVDDDHRDHDRFVLTRAAFTGVTES